MSCSVVLVCRAVDVVVVVASRCNSNRDVPLYNVEAKSALFKRTEIAY